MQITEAEIRKFFPKGQKSWVEALVKLAPTEAPAAGITTRRRWRHLLAQVAAETDGLRLNPMRESLRYSPGRMLEVFSYRLGLAQRQKRFHGKSKAEIAAIVARDPEELAELVYGGRKELGNTQPGDGYRFIGRGPLQTTGREWYEKLGREIGVDLVAEPDLLATDPVISWRACFAEWRLLKANTVADTDNVTAVSKRVNGGSNGLDRRKTEYARAVVIWPDDGAGAAVVAEGEDDSAPQPITPRHADAPPAVITAASLAADGSRSMSWLLRLRTWIAASWAAITAWFGFDSFGAARGTLNEIKSLVADHALVIVLGILGLTLAAILVIQHFYVLAAREGRYVPAPKVEA
jgi:putative chitinase